MHADAMRIVRSEEASRIRQDRQARVERIDRLAVDRSLQARMPPIWWSPEAERREQPLAQERAGVTWADRIAAWRGLFRLTLRKEVKQ